VGKIFGIRFRVTPTSGQEPPPPEPASMPAPRRRRWKRTLLLVSALSVLFFVSVVEHGHPAAGKPGKAGLFAVLQDPLSLFAARSPGERGGGALLSTKPGGPTERVLSTIRDRDPALGDPPPADGAALPVTPGDLAALSPPVDGAAPGAGAAPGDPGLGAPAFAPFAPFSGAGGDPGFLPAGSPPGGGGLPTGGGGVSAVPEPGTWAMMIIGFFSVGAAVRRRRANRPARSAR
jgi:hypothetical protein